MLGGWLRAIVVCCTASISQAFLLPIVRAPNKQLGGATYGFVDSAQTQGLPRHATLYVMPRFRPASNGLRCKNDDDEGEEEQLTPIDRLFQPLVDQFAELNEKDQASLAFIYQGTYFMICIYVGVILVRAYKAAVYGGGMDASPFG